MSVLKMLIPKQGNNPMVRRTPDTIVIHYNGVGGVTAKELAQCFINNNANSVSANYVVDDKDIIKTISPRYMSYGVTGHNNHIINIEVCHKDRQGRFELGTIKNLVNLVPRLMRTYNIDSAHVVRHYDLTHKMCPAYYAGKNNVEWDILHKLITEGVF